ncbi:hypothetical protein DMB66_05255 [Actinoplanes sp. ATCC 53533]|nr:hypothetical protein DMB66_05255 [Actinoplanes sp. ATCC 53533]
MFVHFGLYAVAARHEWVMNREEIEAERYARYADVFDPDLFDAAALARTAKQAGARYVVLTAKHHEGFCLWDTATTDFSAAEALMAMCRELQPHMIVNDRLGIPGDLVTPEQYQPSRPLERDGVPVLWEACQTAPRDAALFAAIGEWMHRHRRAVHGAGPSAFTAPSGVTYTQRGDRLYACLFDWPFGLLHLPDLAGRVRFARLLHDGSELRMREIPQAQQAFNMNPAAPPPGTLTLTLPTRKPEVALPVIELLLWDSP